MDRSLIWVEGDATGWACSNCRWRYPVPTLLGGEDAKRAYDRLAAGRFREHTCEVETGSLAAQPATQAGTAFADRARALIKRGYTPKVAVELVLHEMRNEMEIGHRNDPAIMEKARADAEDFLQKVHRGIL